MPRITTDDDVGLFFEETGDGFPIIFVHEFAGDYRSFYPQVSFFSHQYRCITYCARGYTPSDVPSLVSSYSQERARDDIRSILDALSIEQAHIIGISMGSFAALHFGISDPKRVRSLVLGGCGSGSPLAVREKFRNEARMMANAIHQVGMETVAAAYAESATRVQFQKKDPNGWMEFRQMLSEHSGLGSANTMLGVQAKRPSLFEIEEDLTVLSVPTLVMVGDEDEPCLEVSLYLKRTIPSSGLVFFPITGHTLNLEEPNLFNATVSRFLHQVELNCWPQRDPRSLTGRIITSR